MNDIEKRWEEFFFVMREVGPPSELMSKTWVGFFHAYEVQREDLLRQEAAFKSTK